MATTTLPVGPPLAWLWSCHHCHARYPLGATRRCLHDGHYFCGGTTVSALTGRTVKRHRACGSEFDYVGWEDMSRWRNSIAGARMLDTKLDKEVRKRKWGCETNCEYPSACHHRSEGLVLKKSSRAGIEEQLFAASADVASTSNSSSSTVEAAAAAFESFLDPSFFETESSSSSYLSDDVDDNNDNAPTMPSLTIPKKTGTYIKKLLLSAKNRDTQATTFHPSTTTIEPPAPTSTISPSSSSPIGAHASHLELGLLIPTLTFRPPLPSIFSPDSDTDSDTDSDSSSNSSSGFSFPTTSSTSSTISLYTPSSLTPPPSKPQAEKQLTPSSRPPTLPPLSQRQHQPPDIDMTDSIHLSPTSPGFPPLHSCRHNATGEVHSIAESQDSFTNPLFLHRREEGGRGLAEGEVEGVRVDGALALGLDLGIGIGIGLAVTTGADAGDGDGDVEMETGVDTGRLWDGCDSSLLGEQEQEAGGGQVRGVERIGRIGVGGQRFGDRRVSV